MAGIRVAPWPSHTDGLRQGRTRARVREGEDFVGTTDLNGGADANRALKLALAGYIVLFAGKLVTYYITGLTAMYAEALHSLADMLIAGFLLVAAGWSRKPADEFYRYGYGRAQNVAALVSATVFISFTALEAFREALPKLLHPHTGDYSHLELAIIVNIVALVVSSLPLLQLMRTKESGAATRAQAVESVNDVLALVAVLIGTIMVQRGVFIADGIATLMVGIVISANAVILWRENARALMGRSPEPSVYVAIEHAVLATPGVVNAHGIRAEHVGETLHVDLHVEVARGTLIEQADAIAHAAEQSVCGISEGAICTIHVDPAGA